MAFKEGVEVDHVHAYRALLNLAKDWDSRIDAGTATPHEAIADLMRGAAEFAPEPSKAKKKGAA